MPPRCVALFHEPFEDLGSLASVLDEQGWETRLLDAREGNLAHRIEKPDLLVILGGPMGVYQADRFPFLREEIALASKRLQQDLPTLGICLGCQIMAAALGARVYQGPGQEIGWYPVELECAAESDPAASRIVTRSPLMLHWHGDTFDLPEGATRLARSHRYENQGFRMGRFGYALQFHLEVPAERIHEWTHHHARQLERTPEAQSAADIEAGALRYGTAMADQARAFMRAYLGLLPVTHGARPS